MSNFDYAYFLRTLEAVSKAADLVTVFGDQFDVNDIRRKMCIDIANDLDNALDQLGDVFGRVFVEAFRDAEIDKVLKEILDGEKSDEKPNE